ncbi:SDR family oxidoreductase [Gracilibacillus caseinilyticus]|uniref:SDR family oxidoreductase n=1 Tax=Gracilibacillus caseinilyticus TaxID=2932256 RepID=A0ABY4F0T0_9BACI|nr:NAD(P)H-binding protein [Gracilibacillus caseinilyticus]UOQ49797.1 SDR family oxidoreductase [Gracilibacillus caseinilyticus]
MAKEKVRFNERNYLIVQCGSIGQKESREVIPEAWRERNLSDEEEYYFSMKKKADIELTRSGLDWIILRPSLLVDDPGIGTVSLGPAEFHDHIARADVAETLVALLHEPRISKQIHELNTGSTPI